MLKDISGKFTTKFYIALAVWVILGSGIGLYVYDRLARDKEKEKLAPLATTLACGVERVQTDKEIEIQAAKWLVNSGMPIDVQKVILRSLSALPETASKALNHNGIRFTVDTGLAPYTCARGETGRSASGISCVKATPNDGLFVVLSDPKLLSPDGAPINIPLSEQLESVVLPISFWVLFQGVWRIETPKPPLDNEISIANRLLSLKKYVVAGYKQISGEDDYYHRNFSAAGRQSPTFLTRSLILTASNIYCSKAAYDTLLNREPEAVRRFWDVYGCVLGKPWHMTENEYKKICSETPSSKILGD